MGPKKNVNTKAVAAKERKVEAKEKETAKNAKAAEDSYWEGAGEGAKSKAQAKKDEQAKQREDAAAKKAEAKRLAAEEDAAIVAKKPAKSKNSLAPKVTSFQLQLEREARKKEQEKHDAERKKLSTREVDASAYDAMIAAPNTNKAETDTVEARSVGEALAALDVSGEAEVDRHPERRMKAAFEAYQERELPNLKLEKPGLKQSQYKDMLWKQWQKAPENPMNKLRM